MVKFWFRASIQKITEASSLAYFPFQRHKLTNEFLEGVDIRFVNVGEGTERNLEKTMKKHVKQHIKKQKELLNEKILPTETSN